MPGTGHDYTRKLVQPRNLLYRDKSCNKHFPSALYQHLIDELLPTMGEFHKEIMWRATIRADDMLNLPCGQQAWDNNIPKEPQSLAYSTHVFLP